MRSFYILLILLSASFSYFSAFASSPSSICSDLLEAFRQEVIGFAHERASILRVSVDTGREHAYITTATQENDHIIYIASGPDIYRPLMNFPGVRHYHLFDILAYWGESPNHFISELISRIASLPDAEVSILNFGFIEVLDSEFLKREWDRDVVKEIEAEYIGSSILREPLTIGVKFKSQTYGLIEKIFYLHFGDMAQESHFSSMLDFIPSNERLLATFQTGITGTPHASSIRE